MYSFYWPKVAVLQDTNDSAESCWHWNRFSRAVISKLLFVGLAAMVSTSELFRKSMRDHPRREREKTQVPLLLRYFYSTIWIKSY